MQHKAGKLVAGGEREWRRRVEAPANLRRVDAEQPDTPERRDVDRVAIENGTHEHRV